LGLSRSNVRGKKTYQHRGVPEQRLSTTTMWGTEGSGGGNEAGNPGKHYLVVNKSAKNVDLKKKRGSKFF